MTKKILLLSSLLAAFVLVGCNKDSNPLKYPDKLPDVVSETVDTVFGEGIVMKTYYFNSSNTAMRVVCYNAEGKVTMYDLLGAAEVIVLEEDTGEERIQTTTFYDENRNPIASSSGAARHRVVSDKNGTLKEISFFNTKGKPVISSLTEYPYASCKFDCNESGLLTTTTMYDTLMQVIEPITENTYNSNNQVIRASYLTKDRKLMENSHGVAYVLSDFDEKGILQTSFHSLSGKLVRAGEDQAALVKYVRIGDACIVEEYDENNVLIDASFDDAELDIVVDSWVFSDAKRVGNMLEFAMNAKFELDVAPDPFDLLWKWNLSSDNSYTASNLNAGYNLERWKHKKTVEYQKAAWDYYKSVSYLEENKELLLTVFEKVKNQIPRYITPKMYRSSGLSSLVGILMDAYSDIYSCEDPDERLSLIYETMAASDEDYASMDDLHEQLEESLESSLVSLDLSQFHYDDEEAVRKSIEVWAYSFWGRRYNEGIVDDVYQIVSSIQEMY